MNATAGRADDASDDGKRTSIIANKYPPAEPGASEIGPLKAAVGVANATPRTWAA